MALTLTPEVETVVEEQARRQIVQQQGRAAAASKEDARPCQKKMLYLVTGFFGSGPTGPDRVRCLYAYPASYMSALRQRRPCRQRSFQKGQTALPVPRLQKVRAREPWRQCLRREHQVVDPCRLPRALLHPWPQPHIRRVPQHGRCLAKR